MPRPSRASRTFFSISATGMGGLYHPVRESARMGPMSLLFTPIKIGSLVVPNRFVRSATHDYMADDAGFITDANVALFSRLAEGEVGLIITGHANVQPSGKASPRQTGVFDDKFIEGLARIPAAVHRYA